MWEGRSCNDQKALFQPISHYLKIRVTNGLSFISFITDQPTNTLSCRIEGVHGYGTRSARGGLYLSTRDHGSVGYRVPKEWATIGEAQRGVASLASFKRWSRAGFLAGYAGFECRVAGCGVCAWGGVPV